LNLQNARRAALACSIAHHAQFRVQKFFARARLLKSSISPYKTHEITLRIDSAFRSRTKFARRELQRAL